jgi:chromosome segregation ATPase
MAELEKELDALRDASHENILEKLKAFEDEFIAGIKKRNNDINLKITEWQGGLDGRLSAIGENSETALRELERNRADEMKKSLTALNARLASELERLKSEASAFEKGILDQMNTAEVMKQKALDEYRLAQDIEFTRLKALADDSEKKDAELRRYMQEMTSQLKDEFSTYQGEAEKLRKTETENFSLAAAHFKGGMAELEKGLEELRLASYDNISEKLKTFEKEFFADLNKRNNDIDLRITEWQGGLDGRLSAIAENSETALRESERSHADEMKKNLAALDAHLVSELERLKSETDAFEKEIQDQMKAAEEMERQALETNGVRLEEYRRAQDLEFRRLETLADDSRKLDAELRLYIRDLIGQLKDEFSGYKGEAEELRKAETENFSLATLHLKEGMVELEKGLEELRAASYESISVKLRTFEDEFLNDINKRSNDINLKIVEWRSDIEGQLSIIDENLVTAMRELEQSRAEEMKKNLSALDARLVSELEHLKSETGAFEEGILDQMKAADDSVSSFKDQLDRGLEETRKEAEISIKAEIKNYSLTAAETVKKHQRDLDDSWNELSARLRELDENVEEARRRIGDLAAETDNRIASVRVSVEDAERHIREAVDQTKLIDKADMMRLEMERRIEDLKGDIDRLDQRRAEAARIENEFIKIKRIEDEINSKMIKIFSEERRVENMEANFTRFLQISRSVEDKLTEVTASDDTLQAVQLKIRKLEEALGSTEEKFQRIEKKNQILDNTIDGIEKSFKALQDTEKLSEKIGVELVQYADELEKIKVSIEKLSAESEKAASAVDRIDVLNNDLEEIEERIKSMQRARQWIADAETRLEELNRQAQTQARAIDAMVKGKKTGPAPDLGEGAPSQQKKENIIILARQGWTVDEIAKNLKISRGEVELTLEFAPKD